MRMFYIVVFLLSLLTTLKAQAYNVDYQITPDKSLDTLKVKVCFDEQVPKALYNGMWDENRRLGSAVDQNQRQLRVRDNRMSLKGVLSRQCIRYEADISSNNNRRRSNYRAGSDKVINNDSWLWQPKNLTTKDRVRLSFNLPKGYNVSTPWTAVEASGNSKTFLLTTTPYDWTSRIAIGQFTIEPVKVANQTLQVAILNSKPPRKQQYIDWIKQVSEAIAGVTGDFPVDNAQILITPIGAKREAVPWGEVQRGGSVAAHFFVDSFRPIQQFKDDWTAAHELSHMLVPYISRDELWLSEGIASYYQNVARAKAGMISPQIGWQKLLAGFSRGIKSAKKESLSNASAIMQMYWGGAAMYLMADAQLRQRSNNQQHLGTVLAKFNQCCRLGTQRWSGLALMKKFDQLSNSLIFTSLYQTEAQARRFPDIMPLLGQMGFKQLKADKGSKLSDKALMMMR
ncbi:MAG: putative metalloprotease with PDZ domain [Phenylobacterium sp.]|jgi:predicted metalloprotease with PDZ domain